MAFGVATQTYLSMRTHGHSFPRLAAWQLACWTFWALAAPIVLRTGETLAAANGSVGGKYQRAVALCVALAGIHAIVVAQCTVWLQPFIPVQTHHFGDALISQLGLLLIIDVLAYSVVLLIGGSFAVYDRARRLELRESRLEAQLVRANLEALRLEIQPHFLFNTLNSIAALVRRKSQDRALAMIVGLSELLRDTLERRHLHLSTVESEVDFVRKYVNLYRARFSDRLEVTYDLDPAALGCRVPTFVLQPLVENAFRHGLAPQVAPCTVQIGARLESARLRLWVADDGIGVAPNFDITTACGTGIGNVRSRVEGLCGHMAQVEVRRREAGGTLAQIVIPTAPEASIELVAS